MIELGKFQNLIVVNRRDHGAYLAEREDAGPDGRVLLPAREVPEDVMPGEPLRAFIYRDSSDRLIATLEKPYITLHEVKLLAVKEVTKIGAFLDWGLPKDLLLPFHEMIGKVKAGDQILVALYKDRSGRLAATMKIYPYLKTRSPYAAGDTVSGRIYQIEDSFGVFVAVDDLYSGLIPRREAAGHYRLNEVMELRVTGVKEDGKLDLTDRDRAWIQMDEDAEQVLMKISEDFGGVLPFDDRADPERIREVFGLSKAAFKRAAGRLYRERRVVIGDGVIRVLPSSGEDAGGAENS